MANKLGLAISCIAIGFMSGWGVRGLYIEENSAPVHVEYKFDGGDLEPHTHIEEKSALIREEKQAIEQLTQQSTSEHSQKMDKAEVLQKLLNEGRYEEAVQWVQQQPTREQVLALRQQLFQYLQSLLSKDSDHFIDLSDAYLTVYYDDVEAYLLLAEFNAGQNYFIETVGVFQLAKEYAYDIEARQQVRKKFSGFLKNVDQHLVSLEDWYNLNQVYLQAMLVEMLDARQQIRFAEVLLENGDQHYAKEILKSLVNGRDSSAEARAMLAALNEQTETELSNDSEFTGSVKLIARGNQFLVPVAISNASENTLLIDTGASLTTLSREAFDAISSELNYQFIGRRMFSTANGLARGDVLRVDSIRLGDFIVTDANIAVLDFSMSSDAVGLLGMNVLGKFRFQIDQDEAQLLLEPR